jgi:hypothetical protein
MIRAIGQVADDAANVATELPLKVGAVANDAVSEVADGDKVHLVTDLYRRLRVFAEGAAADNAAIVGNPIPIGGKVTTAAPSASDGDVLFLSLTTGGALRTSGSTTPAIATAALAAEDEGTEAALSVDLSSRLRTLPYGIVADAYPRGTDAPLKVGAVAEDDPTAAAAVSDQNVCHLITDLNRQLRTHPAGGVADNAANVAAEYPIKVGGVAVAAPAADVAVGDMAHLAVDLYRRLWTHPTGDVKDNAAASTEAPLRVGAVAASAVSQVTDTYSVALITDLYRRLRTVTGGEAVSESLVDTTNLTVGTYYYPSEGGWDMAAGNQGNYRDVSLTGKLISGEGITCSLGLYGTNDEDATAASRDWVLIQGWDSPLGTSVQGAVSLNSTTTFGLVYENINFKYVRAVVTASGTVGTVIVKARRKTV